MSPDTPVVYLYDSLRIGPPEYRPGLSIHLSAGPFIVTPSPIHSNRLAGAPDTALKITWGGKRSDD